MLATYSPHQFVPSPERIPPVRYPEAWDMLMFGLRLGPDPRVVVTTTPKPIKIIRELIADPTTVPVLCNRAAMGWIIGYTVHTWELSALRAWGVTFLAALSASQGAPSWLPDPTRLFPIAGLAGIAVSISGNETAQQWGRGRV